MTTITGRTINVKANQSKRTFTIRVDGFKYRTIQMNKEEFESSEYMTANDWQQFLNGTNDYYKI
jgi:predicted secreted protein